MTKEERELMAEVVNCFEDLIEKHLDICGAYCSETMGDEGQGTMRFYGDYLGLDNKDYDGEELYKHHNEILKKAVEIFRKDIVRLEKARSEKRAKEDHEKFLKEIHAWEGCGCWNCKHWNKEKKECTRNTDYVDGKYVPQKRERNSICYGWVVG